MLGAVNDQQLFVSHQDNDFINRQYSENMLFDDKSYLNQQYLSLGFVNHGQFANQFMMQRVRPGSLKRNTRMPSVMLKPKVNRAEGVAGQDYYD